MTSSLLRDAPATEADYRFDYRDPVRIDRVDVRLFEAFPGTQRLRIQFATAKSQGAAELTAARPRVAL